MKQFRTLLIATALFFGAVTVSNAQNKMAHIDTQQLIAAMPSMKTAQNQLEKIQKTYENEIKNMATELQNRMKQYQAEAPNKTDEENQRRGQEVQGMRDSILKYEQNAQQEMGKKQEVLITPIMEKARVAIQKVARAQGIQYVMDSTVGSSGLILAEGTNCFKITPSVALIIPAPINVYVFSASFIITGKIRKN